jgi:hypothetical protein
MGFHGKASSRLSALPQDNPRSRIDGNIPRVRSAKSRGGMAKHRAVGIDSMKPT